MIKQKKVCKKGHQSEFTPSGQCKKCKSIYIKDWRKKKIEKRKREGSVIEPKRICKKNHQSGYKDGRCIECSRLHQKVKCLKNKDKYSAKAKIWYLKNKESVKIASMQRYKDNPQRTMDNATKWKRKNPEKVKAIIKKRYWNNKEESLAQNAKWHRENRDKACAINARRRFRLENQTPQWADFHLIGLMYKACLLLRQFTGIEYHVDHYYPLKGKLVSGLHVHNNLQILTKEENLIKGNKFKTDQ